MPNTTTDSLFASSPPVLTGSIIDNSGENSLKNRLHLVGGGASEIAIASAFFSLDALQLLADTLEPYQRIRILFGDDAEAKQRVALMRLLRTRSDEDLLAQREQSPTLAPLRKINQLFVEGKIEARCYTAKKFHAKAYLFRRQTYPMQSGILGSGNFTRAGLTQNVELNVVLTGDQDQQLAEWFEARWQEAVADNVTEDILAEIRRQIDLYEPYVLYLKALFAWGQNVQDDTATVGPTLADILDPHQEMGYRQAVRILDRQSGVMVCDGVGLGKSFIALALMERYCRQNKNVLLIAPKSILVSSWEGYLKQYLGRYLGDFGSLFAKPMTWFGFDIDDMKADPEKAAALERLTERADVIVVDESHNFRTPSASRYENLFRLVAPNAGGRKKIILLTATPINTAYRDFSAQIALTTHEEGEIDGYNIAQIRRAAAQLDKDSRDAKLRGTVAVGSGQLSLELVQGNDDTLRHILESTVIQRSRKTCRELAAVRGKDLRFPVRRAPECLEYRFDSQSAAYKDVIELADKRFRPGVTLLKKLAEAQKAVEEGKSKRYNPEKLLQQLKDGIKLAAFLPEQYRRGTDEGTTKSDRDEIHLAKLVFANALKQLESSPVAFQGILQSIATGLIARLKHIQGDAADALIAPHRDWVNTPLFAKEAVSTSSEAETDSETESDVIEDGDAIDVSGTETDEWLKGAIRSRGLNRKLSGFSIRTHDVSRWASDIVSDLRFLQEIHEATMTARQQPDPKLSLVLETLHRETTNGKRILVFTQSQRTADYLERELKKRVDAIGIARIDSRVEQTRAAILYAFCPGYNKEAGAPSVPKSVHILISTDVLSEGVNLQEANAILNYDIHWNPVRLIQRIGRVDRRLNPVVTPDTHEFGIFNVVPPSEIEQIIGLVEAVEERTIKISKTLGLEVAFFKATDDAGTLKEFNAKYDGTLTEADEALNHYVSLTTITPPDEKTKRLLELIPPGAFGVWKGAPKNGVFALFTMEAKRTATDADRERFAGVIGRPMLILQCEGDTKPLTDGAKVLQVLEKIVKGEPSGTPTDETTLQISLKKLRDAVRNSFRDIHLPSTIAPRLVCWMELRVA